jgi:ferric-chelate reductase
LRSVVSYTAFFILVCVHTPYAAPWIYPPVALYAADLAIRLLRFRVKDATLRAADHQMTLVDVHDAGRGWAAGQHVRLRVFAGARVLESHPLTALAAPPARSVLAAAGVVGRDTLPLGVRAAGDWSRSLNSLAKAGVPAPLDPDCAPLLETDGVPVTVMIDGPYGGCSLDLGEYENVLLLAGGSGATFALGMLDDILGRILAGRLQGERTRRIELAWYIRSYGSSFLFRTPLT